MDSMVYILDKRNPLVQKTQFLAFAVLVVFLPSLMGIPASDG
jgi:hypothetical protein